MKVRTKAVSLSFILILFSYLGTDTAARSDTAINSIEGTYGRWSSDCGSTCSHQVGLDGLLVRKLPKGCFLVFFEARGDQKDYRMFASGRLENRDTLIAYEDVLAFDGHSLRPRSCKTIFSFDHDVVSFDNSESDLGGDCTASTAGTWLTSFKQKRVSVHTNIPANAENVDRNAFWKKQVDRASRACTDR